MKLINVKLPEIIRNITLEEISFQLAVEIGIKSSLAIVRNTRWDVQIALYDGNEKMTKKRIFHKIKRIFAK